MDMFKGYILTKDKHPLKPYTDDAPLMTLDDVEDASEYAGVLAQDTVLVDIDDIDMSEMLADMVEDAGLGCVMRETDRGMHFYFINDGSVTKCWTGVYLACGIKADIKAGVKNSISVLRKGGKDREVVYDRTPYDILPCWMRPIDTKDRGLYGMKDGDGRDSTLFTYILTLIQHGFTKDECRKTLEVINENVFEDKLSDKDIDRITRDDAFPADTFYVKGKFLHDKFGDFLIAQYRIRRVDGVLCYYHDGEYVNALGMLDNLCLRHLRSLPAKSRTEVAKYIEGMLAESVPASDPRYITFDNGVLDIETGEMRPATPDVVTRNIIRHDYVPDAYCALTDRTMDKLACGDPQVRAVMEEAIGYGFYRSSSMSRFIVLTGEKANGKSTFLEVLQEIYGNRNCSNLDINELDERFSTAELAGKLANIGDDISDEFMQGKAVANLKKVVSGNMLKGEYKGQDPFFFKPYVKLFFSANDIPKMRDKTGAVLRRMVIVPFNARFTSDDPDYDPYIAVKLKSEESLRYLVRLGVEGLRRILKQKDFTHAVKVDRAVRQYEVDNNPILSFLTEHDVVDKGTDEVYRQYRVFCIENGFKEANKNTFSKDICRNAGVVTKAVRIDGTLRRIYVKNNV